MVKQIESIGGGSIPQDLRDLATDLMCRPVNRAVLVTESHGEVTLRALGRDMDSIEIAGMLSIALTAVASPADA
jgi:hypothetical protein